MLLSGKMIQVRLRAKRVENKRGLTFKGIRLSIDCLGLF